MSNNALITTTPKPSPLAVMAARFNADPAKLLDTLRATVFSAARNNEELQALVIVANSYNLNPLTKEIYAFPAKGGGIVPVVSVDGWANLANSHPEMDGVDFEWVHADNGALVSCTAIIHRKDRAHPTRVTEYLSECRRQTEPWKMEHRMLRHKAFCQAVRIAFGFSGVYEQDEAERFNERDVTPITARPQPLNPFDALPFHKPAETQPEPKETATTEQPMQDDEDALRFADLMDYLDGTTEPDKLATCLADCKDFKDPAVRANAESKVIARAAGLGFKLKGKEFAK